MGGPELAQVLGQGADALSIELEGDLVDDLVGEAFGSVGLLQRLAAQLCMRKACILPIMASVSAASLGGRAWTRRRRRSRDQTQGRFQTFADNFVRGMRRLPQGLEVYRHLLQAATDASDEELMTGVDSNVLLQRICGQTGR